MIRLLLPQLIVLALCTLSAAQTPEQSNPCPVVSVQTPAGIIEPGARVKFTAAISGGDSQGLRYAWSISKGKIVGGQGTNSINMVYSGYPRMTATVIVSGLPAGCKNTASEIYEFIIDPGPIKLGEIAGSGYTIDKRLLSNIERETRENPNAQLYVALQFEVGTSDNFMRRIRTRIANQLKKTRIDKNRITFVMADKGDKSVRFWLIPPGADKPAI